jgi:UDP-N-acetylglucosamine--N-acetylmuramyl-(pentapeptide) pyrophosphoryl-undecaprenol N-acetylglucosamine transferase
MRGTSRNEMITGGASMPRVVVGGIGTGGHYFPAAVVAQALQDRAFDVVFLVRRGYLEDAVARRFGLKTFAIKARPFYGRSLFEQLLFTLSLVAAVYRLRAVTHHAIAFAFGGFGAVPLIISAMLNRCRFYLFEPNRVPGRATRFFADAAQKVFLGMPTEHGLGKRAVVTGIPVRSEFKRIETVVRHPRKPRTPSVLFYGGSQGAHRLNDIAIDLQSMMPEKWRFTIISGSNDYERVIRLKRGNTRVLSFAERPWEEVSGADIVVSRAGALAGYEILCLNRKAIFVPFPYAVDNHQYYNAQYFSMVGNAMLIEEKNLTAKALAVKIRELYGQSPKARPDIVRNAEEIIVNELMDDLSNEEA